MTYQNIGLGGNKQSIPLTRVYIRLVSQFGLSGGDISPSQIGALPSCSALHVALLSFPLTFVPSLFLKSLPTPLSLSPTISVYIVMLNPADVASVTSICLPACLLGCCPMTLTQLVRKKRRRRKTRGEKSRM